jgi:hypothetical protein
MTLLKRSPQRYPLRPFFFIVISGEILLDVLDEFGKRTPFSPEIGYLFRREQGLVTMSQLEPLSQ